MPGRGRGRGRCRGRADQNRNVTLNEDDLRRMIAETVAQALEQERENRENQTSETHQSSQTNHDEGNQGRQVDAYVWLERFLKQKPESFRSAPVPIDAENWIVHMEKIFDALGCDDQQKVKLAVYKLEGDAQRWWRIVKSVRTDREIETLDWQGFTELFYKQYFSTTDRDAYLREFSAISQGDEESITDYMGRFVRLAGFAGTVAGTQAQQAEKFKWGLRPNLRMTITPLRFQNVAEVADAAKDIEKELLDFKSNRKDKDRKRGRDDQLETVQGRPWNKGGQPGQWHGANQSKRFPPLQFGGQRQFQQYQQPRQWTHRQSG